MDDKNMGFLVITESLAYNSEGRKIRRQRQERGGMITFFDVLL